MKRLLFAVSAIIILSSCSPKQPEPMRGIVLTTEDLRSADWAALAHEAGINTIGTHITPDEVLEYMQSPAGHKFMADCEKYGIAVEHQLHSMSQLLPRELFAVDSTMFRMDTLGRRVADFNCCAHSQAALDSICQALRRYAALLPATNHRYYYWVDDNKLMCSCPECAGLSQSEQALIIENAMITALRELDPKAKLAHLAYIGTMQAPRKVKPAEGIFLEFAPFYRVWDKPLAEGDASSPRPYGKGITHADYLRHLQENLEVFGAEDAVVLEYWLDASLFSNWTKPAKQVPWHPEVFRSDVETYREMGVRNITTFGAYLDSAYFAAYPGKDFLREYGSIGR